MKTFIGLFSLITLLVTAGCVVAPAPPAGVSVGVYGEYPYYYHGYGYYHSSPYYSYHRYPSHYWYGHHYWY